MDPVEKENMKLGLNPIGTSLANTNETPYFECTFLKGNISGSAEYLNIASSMTGERFTTLVNPIINLYDMTYESRPVTTDALDTTRPTEEIIPTTPDFPISSPRLADGRFIKVERDYFIILLDEENTENEFDNFSIAIFEVDETTDDTTKLFFLPQEGKVDEDGFYDPNIDDEVPLVTDDYVDYYLEISADHEIDSAQLCSLVSTDEFDGKFVDPLLDCEDIRTRRANIRREIDVPPEEGTEC
jgi:hypothetical protein